MKKQQSNQNGATFGEADCRLKYVRFRGRTFLTSADAGSDDDVPGELPAGRLDGGGASFS